MMPQPKKTAKHKRKGQHARIARLLAKHPHYLVPLLPSLLPPASLSRVLPNYSRLPAKHTAAA